VTGPNSEIVLALNSGSSSLKFGLYALEAGEPVALFDEHVDSAADGCAMLDRIAAKLAAADLPTPTIVGHRIVHGGPGLRQHCRIDAGVIVELKAALPFAPLHGPASLKLIGAATARYPDLSQIACFDTAFHMTLPPVAHVLPIAKPLRDGGVRRYGFHGLSCESVVHQLGEECPDKLIIAHLGNGASVTAVKAGRSIDTSMGLTPSGGVMMGTRSGDLDPGLMIHLLTKTGMDPGALAAMIDQQSGMLGVSGVSGDMRALHAAAAANADARLAIEMFCYSVRKQMAAMIAALGGVDMIVFTGGIGENDAVVRARICEGLTWAGVPASGTDRGEAGCEVRAIACHEDKQIARHCHRIVSGTAASR